MIREKLEAILADAKGLHRVVASRNPSAIRDAIDDLIWSLEAYMAALDAPAQPATPARWPVHPEPLTDAAYAEQRWQARHPAQPVHPEPLDVERLGRTDEAVWGARYMANSAHPSIAGWQALAEDALAAISWLREASEPEGAKE